MLLSSIVSAVKTAYLFNKADIISTIGPVVVVGCVLIGLPDLKTFFCGLLWQELHLIAFEIQNQIIGLEEDKLSKPWRPLVSGRLTIQTAQKIYTGLIALSLLVSVYTGTLAPSLFHLCAMYAYNECGLGDYWVLKSAIGSLGYVAYCWGVTIIYDQGRALSHTSILAVVLSGLIFTTTGHAQDFRDRDGDAAIGRKTLAHVLPQTFARWSLMALMFGWTTGLIYLWGPPTAVSVVFFALAVYTTAGYVRDYSQEADRVSYWWYNIWLIAAHVMPLFKRLADARIQVSAP